MNWVGYRAFSNLLIICMAIALGFLGACSNKVLDVEAEGQAELADDDHSLSVKNSLVSEGSSKSAYPSSFKPNDKEYPYAGVPRIVIETENRVAIKDRETEIPAKLQIWGEKQPESEILDLTIRGRGNSSWGMPKKSYKIEFDKKQSMLGMPKDKDWALIANYADKTLMRNYITYRLSAALGAYYAPRCEFAELYLNGEYLGVYLLTETIKISENRVNIPKNDNSYIVEFDGKYRADEQVVFSDVLTANNKEKAYRVHNPKNATETTLEILQKHIEEFEKYLKTIESGVDNKIEVWIDVEESLKHYWIQEFTKNPDANFYTSVYFTWTKGEKIKMGPVWDFDLAFGNYDHGDIYIPENWRIRNYWYMYLFRDSSYKEYVKDMWCLNRDMFGSVIDFIETTYEQINKAALNNFKRWNILRKQKYKSFDTYEDAIADLKNWISQRIQWIDSRY